MIRRIRTELRTLRHDEPGARFENGHARTRVRSNTLRLLLVGLGLLLMVVAATTFFVPGPNFILVLAGLALVSGQSRTAARLIDRGEVAARASHQQYWVPFGHKRAVILLLLVLAAAFVALAGWYYFAEW